MSPDYAHTGWASEQRMQKAIALRDELVASGLWADMELWPPARLTGLPGIPTPGQQRNRRDVERDAGVRKCSEETWHLVRQLLDRDRVDRFGR